MGGSASPGSSTLFNNNTTSTNTNLQANTAGNTSQVGVGGQQRTTGQSFVGVNMSTNQSQSNFVGVNSAQLGTGSQNGMGGMGTSGMGGMGGMGTSGMGGMGGMGTGGMGGMGMGGQGNMGLNNTQQTTPQVRIAMVLGAGFERALPPPTEISIALEEHLAALPGVHFAGPGSAQVEMRGRLAILRGVVLTEHDRDLAERVVRLEATVDQVQNQLVVANPTPPKTALPAAERIPAADSSAPSSAGPLDSSAPDSSAVDSSCAG